VQNEFVRIGELATQAQVNIQTLRFYERKALLRAPLRSASGYRSYELSDLEQVRFIRNCQGLGFTAARDSAIDSSAQRPSPGARDGRHEAGRCTRDRRPG
jgi:DNA-binding transcriptional MerR regulator